MAVPVTTQPTFSAGKPTMLFEGEYLASPFPATGVTYDVTRDGRRILAILSDADDFQLVASPNWITELRRRVAESGHR